MPDLEMLTQPDVPLPWSRCSQMLPPLDCPCGRVGSSGEVPLARL